MSETGSQVSWDDFSDSRCVSPALSCDFDISDTSSWADSGVSRDPEITSPEPPSNASIWARFNSGLSRFTQELAGKNPDLAGKTPDMGGKTPAVLSSSATIPSIRIDKLSDLSLVVPPRDDFVEGAESDLKLERSDSGHWSRDSGHWSLTESLRKFSAGFNTKSYHSDASDANGFGRVANSHSSNMLDDACGPNIAAEDNDISQDVLRQLTVRDDSGVAVSASSSSTTVTLDYSTTGPFATAILDNPAAKYSDELGSSSTPQRLASKPPLPQRSGTLSPRDAASRPRPTHRRSQSLQHFTPATASIVPLSSDKSPSAARTENCPPVENDAATQSTTAENVQSTYEIFV